MEFISFKNVEINDGFWKEKQKLNENVTVKSVKDRFTDSGRFEAFKFNWAEGMENQPHIFWDSDVAKWIEGGAYILNKKNIPWLEKEIDRLIDLIEKNQQKDGYFNIYFTIVKPGERFTNRDCHELYCAGHLIEGAVAYYEATGKDKFLKCMCRYADLIEKIFVKEKSASFSTPGHEEIELALVKLYKCTKNKKYLELSKHFIDLRGTLLEDNSNNWMTQMYNQSHKPCRKQFTAEGHSVRACYLYTGMADIAYEYTDTELKNACEKIFDDIYTHKLYITGGVGQSSFGEAFTVPYDLSNTHAYTETCAAIALAMFCLRLQKLNLDSRYGDVIEKAIYNGILSGLSSDGKSFFYENPLEINLAKRKRNVSVINANERFPITQRLEVFGCSCCPPNMVRFLASIGDYIYGKDENTFYVHQFISSEMTDGNTVIKQNSGYPYNGNIILNIENAKQIAVRIPEYSKENFTIKTNGKNAEYTIKNGYAFIDITDNSTVEILFDITPKIYYANPKVYDNCGRCAVVAGPVVYCAEGIDNDTSIWNYRLTDTEKYEFIRNNELNTTDIVLECKKISENKFKGLYSTEQQYEKAKIRLIPYFAFANRGESDMTVWLL